MYYATLYLGLSKGFLNPQAALEQLKLFVTAFTQGLVTFGNRNRGIGLGDRGNCRKRQERIVQLLKDLARGPTFTANTAHLGTHPIKARGQGSVDAPPGLHTQ